MLRKRLLILLSGCFLMASAAWADDVGYVDCSSHPEDTPVFEKSRKTPDMVASIPCGERFTILLYGFIFSRIQTRDGKVGYVYSNLVSVGRSVTSVQQPTSARVPAVTSSVPQTTATVAQPNPTTPTQPQPAAAQPTQAQVTPAAAPAATANVPMSTETVVQPKSATPTQPQPASALVAPAAPAAEAASNVTETVATAAQPSPATVSRPQPVPAEPKAPAIRDASVRTSWERRIPGARMTSLVELFGGYAFARLNSGGTGSNLNGALGSFGWNIKPWLQIVADSSYNVLTVSGTKNVLYGNHFGPRFFRRGRNRWGATPFVEALFGGTRADSTVSGAGGYKTSDNCFSIKAGGGLDIHPSRHLEIRLLDVDYYRTSFGTNVRQINFWVSTGIVVRLFGGGAE